MSEAELKWHSCPVDEFSGLHRVHPTGRYVSTQRGGSVWFTVIYEMKGFKVDMTWWLVDSQRENWILTKYEFLRMLGIEEKITDAYMTIVAERGEEE